MGKSVFPFKDSGSSSDEIVDRVIGLVKKFDSVVACKVTETADFQKDLSLDSLDRVDSVSFSSPIDVGSHNPPPFRVQCSRWHSAQYPHWHLFLSPIDVGPPLNPSPSGPSVLAGTRFFLQSMWDHHQIHPPFRAQRPYCTPPRVYLPSGNNLFVGTSSDDLTIELVMAFKQDFSIEIPDENADKLIFCAVVQEDSLQSTLLPYMV
ncbi:Acyl carrier protein 3, mitochondrial, partial [Cucurbita argyrosperma subsp. argyrosperma]